MNKLRTPVELPDKVRRLPIQAVQDARDSLVAAVDTIEEQKQDGLGQFGDVFDKLDRID